MIEHDWAEDELGQADLGHAARTHRAVAMLRQMVLTPAGTVSATFPDAAQRTGAYRFLESHAFTHHELSDALHDSCARRCREHALVIVPVDGSSLRHTDRRGDDGVGRLGSRGDHARGLKSMIALVMTYDGVPLGIGAHVLWARQEQPLTPHHTRALEQRESRWWTVLPEQLEASLRAQGADCTPWYQDDREGDASHVLLRGMCAHRLFTVRAKTDRILAPDPHAPSATRRLRATLEQSPVRAVMYLEVGRGPGRTERIARCTVRYAVVPLKLSERWSKRKLGTVQVTAVWVREEGTAPNAEQALEWLLLTSYPVASVDDAVRVVRAYSLRFRIERVHWVWKSGSCEAERSQLESVEALQRWWALHLSVAVHHEHVLHLSRTQPELPADQVFSTDTIEAALVLAAVEQRKTPPPGSTPSLGVMVEIIAKLGGYTYRSSAGGPPGAKTFQRGMDRVDAAEIALRAYKQTLVKPTPADTSG